MTSKIAVKREKVLINVLSDIMGTPKNALRNNDGNAWVN